MEIQPQQLPVTAARETDMEKPQKKFKDEIDNSEDTPFLPKIKEKLNAKAPLPALIVDAQRDFAAFVKTLENVMIYYQNGFSLFKTLFAIAWCFHIPSPLRS